MSTTISSTGTAEDTAAGVEVVGSDHHRFPHGFPTDDGAGRGERREAADLDRLHDHVAVFFGRGFSCSRGSLFLGCGFGFGLRLTDGFCLASAGGQDERQQRQEKRNADKSSGFRH